MSGLNVAKNSFMNSSGTNNTLSLNNTFITIVFHSTTQSDCLVSSHYNTTAVQTVPLLGRNYTLDHQCTLIFGANATACDKTVRLVIIIVIIIRVMIHLLELQYIMVQCGWYCMQ